MEKKSLVQRVNSILAICVLVMELVQIMAKKHMECLWKRLRKCFQQVAPITGYH